MKDRLRARLIDCLGELRRSERGIALPMAMMITVIALGLAAVPIVASVSSQSGGSHDNAGNEALAAAEAGAELAILRQGELLHGTPDAACVSNGALAAGGWCPQIGPKPIGEAEYRYQLRPCYAISTGDCAQVISSSNCNAAANQDPVQVVSTGIGRVGGREVKKRVAVTACANSTAVLTPGQLLLVEKRLAREVIEKAMKEEVEKGTSVEVVPGKNETKTVETTVPAPNVFVNGQIVGIDWLNMNNNAQVYNGGAGSNGWVKMVGSANVCGTVGYGTTFTTDNSSSLSAPSGCAAGRKAAKGTAEYPAVALPADISTNNSNTRLAAADPVGPNVWQRGNISWNSSNRSLTVTYDQLTLEGTAPYYLCKLTLAGGSKLLAGSGKKIKIYFDAPENCPGLNGSSQLQIANGAYVGPDASSGPIFYFVGSDTTTNSKIELGGGANVSQFIVYAPKSTIVANNGVNLKGVIIGKTLELGGGASINRTGAFTPPSAEEFLPPVKKTETIEVPGQSTTQTSASYKKHEEEVKKLAEEITKLESETPSTVNYAATSIKRGSFVECSATTTGSSPDSGC